MDAELCRPRVARVVLPTGEVTHTVLGADRRPVPSVDQFLEHLRVCGSSPNTVQAYARGLAAWWQVLTDRGYDWRDVPGRAVSEYLRFLRSGDLPSATRVGPDPRWLAPSSVQQRFAAVQSFYLWAEGARDDVVSTRRLRRTSTRASRYTPFLDGVGPRSTRSGPSVRVRRPTADRPPVLTPEQIELIVEAAGARGTGRDSELRAARDRLLFALLPESGLRLGEVLSLKHCDFHVGRGDTPCIEVVPRQDHPHGCRVKNDKGRRLYVSDQLEAVYSGYVWSLVDAGIDLEVEDLAGHWVFVNVAREPRWQPMRPETVYDRVAAISRHLGDQVPSGWSPHWMRHTHATALLLSGCPPHVVMRRLGHADIQTTTNAYGWVTEDAQMRALSGWRQYAQGWEGVL